jgi:plasmid stabilization system protein ParE
MPRLIIAEGAALGLERCHASLDTKSPRAVQSAGQAIAARLLMLQTTLQIGRPFDIEPTFRKLPIAFGEAGYVAAHSN